MRLRTMRAVNQWPRSVTAVSRPSAVTLRPERPPNAGSSLRRSSPPRKVQAAHVLHGAVGRVEGDRARGEGDRRRERVAARRREGADYDGGDKGARR